MLNNLVGNMTKLSQQTKLQLAVVLDLCDHTKTLRSFLLRDAMHARYLSWAVSVSVTSRCSIETDERIELVFGV